MNLIYGHGYNDGTRPTKIDSKRIQPYEIWYGMIKRCYAGSEKYKSYSDCTVSENFKNYSYFYDWYTSKHIPDHIPFNLDKDLLLKGNRVYSEHNCVMIPKSINGLIVTKKNQRGENLIGVSYIKRRNRFRSQISINGKNKTLGYFKTEIEAFLIYKDHKEKYIKEMADQYKDVIDPRAYNALMNYQVEITD